MGALHHGPTLRITGMTAGRRYLAMAARLWWAAAAAVAVAACSSAAEPVPTPVVPDIGAEVDTELSVVFATTDLAMGTSRVVFGVLDGDSRPVGASEAGVTFVYLEMDPPEVRAVATATFVKWPQGPSGAYVVDGVLFGDAGQWGIIVDLTSEDGSVRRGVAGFFVGSVSVSVAVGSLAPLSVHRTAADVADLAELTSSPSPDPDLYRLTIADAIALGRPTVVTFATPAFCQTSLCGPQVQVVSDLKDRYESRASFVHVEVYENPSEIQGDITRGRLSPLMDEWGLRIEPFTYVLDGDGLVRSKFEGFVTVGELEVALVDVLGP